MNLSSKQKGFTLIELIITIAILAILVAILVVAINPGEQLARARDAKRVADLGAIVTALNLYVAQATTTINLSGDTTANARCKSGTGTATLFSFTTNNYATTTATYTAESGSTTQTIGGAGWLPARLDLTPGGSPIATLPVDPKGVNDSTYFYVYVCDVTSGVKTFQLDARLESTYFTSDLDVDGKDGGGGTSYAAATYYEVGTDPGLDLL